MFKNPLSLDNFSDPFITYDKETQYYYFIASCQENNIVIYRSKKIENIIINNDKKVVYAANNGVFGPFWAPEMIKIGNNWYIYTSCRKFWDDNQFVGKKYLLILKSKTEDPFDGFVFGSLPDESIFAIDPTVSFINDIEYICYSEVNSKGVQILVIRELSNPLTFTDNKAIISVPTYDWELREGYTGNFAINEGAFFLKKNNRLFIIYSANGCWSDDYCLGVLEYMGGEICNPNSWHKHEKPIFTKGNGVFGVGHASFFNSPDDSEVWCAYHCLLKSNPTREPVVRNTCIQKIFFNEESYPVMGSPVGISTFIMEPSGE